MPNPYSAYVEQTRHNADKALNEFLERHPSDSVKRHIHLLKGDSPDKIIARFADENQIDLIVMGTSAHSGLTVALFGSTAESILNQVGCSVLSVKPDNFVCPISFDAPGSPAPGP